MGSVAGHHSVCSHATKGGEVLSSKSELSHDEGDGTGEDDNAEKDKGGIETSGDGQVVSDSKEGQECPHTQITLTSISQVFGRHEDTDPESDPGEKTQSVRRGTQKAPRRTAPLRNPANHLLRRSHQQTRHSTTRPDKKHGCWTHILMLGIATRLLKASQAGPPETL